jgi:hypothetical protein
MRSSIARQDSFPCCWTQLKKNIEEDTRAPAVYDEEQQYCIPKKNPSGEWLLKSSVYIYTDSVAIASEIYLIEKKRRRRPEEEEEKATDTIQ